MVYSPGMVQVSIVTEPVLQRFAALMQRQRRSSELLNFRQVPGSEGTIIPCSSTLGTIG